MSNEDNIDQEINEQKNNNKKYSNELNDEYNSNNDKDSRNSRGIKEKIDELKYFFKRLKKIKL